MGMQHFVRDINRLYRRETSLHELDFDPAGFEWIDANDNENCVFSFMRRGTDAHDFMVVVMGFTPVPREGYRIGVPEPGLYVEVLNSDADVYGGSNVGNHGAVYTEPLPAHGHPQSLQPHGSAAGDVVPEVAAGLVAPIRHFVPRKRRLAVAAAVPYAGRARIGL